MSASDIIKRIESEAKTLNADIYNAEGLLRLQETMAAYDGEYKLVWSDDLLKELENQPEEKVHKTGLPLLDEKITGFREQQLITIGGHTSHGKTQFGLFLMEQMADLNPVMIPLEQSAGEIISQRKSNGYTVPCFLSPRSIASKVSVEWIEERVVEGIAKYNTKLVLIDHLGYVNDFGSGGEFRGENTAYRIGQVMKGLKNIAKKWNVIILLLVHISQHDETKPPTLEAVKNSSDIIQESDTVLLLWRKTTQKKKVMIRENKTLIAVHKNRRNGRTGSVGLMFNEKTGQYEEENAWVKSMEESAEREVAQEDLFNES